MRNIVFKQQQGSTLIEVMVSMFIIALGVMALMAMQVRSAAAITEAENMNIIAQATQNYVENMATNPHLKATASADKTEKTYNHYAGNVLATSTKPVFTNFSDKTTAQVELANFHKQLFGYQISKIKGLDGPATIEIKDEGVAKVLSVTWNITNDDGKKNSSHAYSYSYILENN